MLHFVAHHIICDDWTKGVILSELGALYGRRGRARAARRSSTRTTRAGSASGSTRRRLRAELAHWQAVLAGAPAALELPADRPRPPAPSLRGARLRTRGRPRAGRARCARSGAREGATFFMTMLAALAGAAAAATRGQEDLVVGTAIDNRGRVELERAVGLYTNVLALRARPHRRAELPRAAAPGARDARSTRSPTRSCPFDRLAAARARARPEPPPGLPGLLRVHRPGPARAPICRASRSEPFEVPKLTSEFDLGLYLDEQRGGLDAVWEYSTDLFEPATIERLARHFLALLRGRGRRPGPPGGRARAAGRRRAPARARGVESRPRHRSPERVHRASSFEQRPAAPRRAGAASPPAAS